MTLEMTFWDVQHGDAAYINTPDGTDIVHDLGTGSYEDESEDFSPLMYLKRRYGVNRLDKVIITHPHKDHIDDIINFDELNPRVFHRPKHLSRDAIMDDVRPRDEHLFEKYFEINERYSTPVDSDPAAPENNGGANIRTFVSRSPSESNLNNHSMVTVASYAGSTIVLPGDNESPSWNELLDKRGFRKAIRDADILLAPHHGREDGFHSDLFDYFTPKLTIVSDGRFGDTSATDRYSDVSSGWTVHKRSGGEEERKCVTTRQDGVINVKFGYTNTEEKPFIEVTID
jgi:competence protein ComEC